MTKIYLGAQPAQAWMDSGYGHGLLAAGATDVLVSFEEFSGNSNLQFNWPTSRWTPPPPPGTKEPKNE